jgi:RNA polymerase sigma-70 factor, ECF subfamily
LAWLDRRVARARGRHGPVRLSELYARHVDAVYRWFRRRIDWAASDLTGETFARAWLVRDRFRDERNGSALPWLLGIAANVLADTVRRDRVETRPRTARPAARARARGRLLGGRGAALARLALERSLDSLPEHERRAVELRVLDELPYTQVATRLSIRPAAARLRMSRALRRLALSVPKEDL